MLYVRHDLSGHCESGKKSIASPGRIKESIYYLAVCVVAHFRQDDLRKIGVGHLVVS